MDANTLIRRLIDDYGYPPQGAKLVADKLLQCSPQIKILFERFWETGEIPHLTIEGYGIQSLTKEHRMNPIAAFLTLDWLLREPEKARESLRKGHDLIQRQ